MLHVSGLSFNHTSEVLVDLWFSVVLPGEGYMIGQIAVWLLTVFVFLF